MVQQKKETALFKKGAISSKFEQTDSAISALFTNIKGVETMIRAYEDGVLVCKTGQTIGALVNADGSFDIVNLTWTGGEPTVSSECLTVQENGMVINTSYGEGGSFTADIVTSGGTTRCQALQLRHISQNKRRGTEIELNDDYAHIASGTYNSSNDVISSNTEISISKDYVDVAGNFIADNYYAAVDMPLFKTVDYSLDGVICNTGKSSTFTKDFTMPYPYKHVVGIKSIRTTHNYVWEITGWNVYGDGASGNTVTLSCTLSPKSATSSTGTITWKVVLSV